MPELSLIALYTFAALLLLWERCKPAHQRVNRPGWYLRAALINGINFLVFLVVDQLWAGPWRVATGGGLVSTMNPLMGALIGYFIFTFVVYWWHRLRHSSAVCWQVFHQLHHSPARIEALTAYYIHPFDLMANLLISNSIVFLLLGLNMQGAAWYTLITGAAGFLIHANIRMPRAVGWVFQTPEMHRLHHESDVHACNYSDIVCWDMLFGTYKNPKSDIDHCGFTASRERQWLAMLIGKDIHH